MISVALFARDAWACIVWDDDFVVFGGFVVLVEVCSLTWKDVLCRFCGGFKVCCCACFVSLFRGLLCGFDFWSFAAVLMMVGLEVPVDLVFFGVLA